MDENLTREQERELLELQAMLLKLRIEAAQAKKKEQKRFAQAPSATLFNWVNSASGFVGNNHLIKLAMLPSRWKHRLILGAALFAWEFYRNQQRNLSSGRSYKNDADVIESQPYFKKIPYKK